METPRSLLQRLGQGADPADWRRWVNLYAPLLRVWVSRQFLQPADVDDVVQQILMVVLRELPQFRHSGRAGAFRTWLRQVLANRLREFRRHAQSGVGLQGADDWLDQLADPNSDLGKRWDEEHDRHLVARLLELITDEFEPITWQAFRRLALDGLPAATVATELGLSNNAVYIAKSRVMMRLRQELAGMID